MNAGPEAAMAGSSRIPAVRDILRPFVLPDEHGKMMDLEQFRQQRNLVLLFCRLPDVAAEHLMEELAAASEAVKAEVGEVLVVVHDSRENAGLLRRRLQLPFPVLADEAGSVLDCFCNDVACLYITDRYREIFAVGQGSALFSVDEVLEWLAHINRQCPE